MEKLAHCRTYLAAEEIRRAQKTIQTMFYHPPALPRPAETFVYGYRVVALQ
jgi:hypothetical protein